MGWKAGPIRSDAFFLFLSSNASSQANVPSNLSISFQHCTWLVSICSADGYQVDYNFSHFLSFKNTRKLELSRVPYYPHSPLFEVQRTHFYSGPRWIFAKTLACLASNGRRLRSHTSGLLFDVSPQSDLKMEHQGLKNDPPAIKRCFWDFLRSFVWSLFVLTEVWQAS